MDLKTFYAPMSADERESFAEKCETSRGHLQNVMAGHRNCAPELAVAVERHSARAVRRWDLRPDDWHLIWPELIGSKGAPRIEKARA